MGLLLVNLSQSGSIWVNQNKSECNSFIQSQAQPTGANQHNQGHSGHSGLIGANCGQLGSIRANWGKIRVNWAKSGQIKTKRGPKIDHNGCIDARSGPYRAIGAHIDPIYIFVNMDVNPDYLTKGMLMISERFDIVKKRKC